MVTNGPADLLFVNGAVYTVDAARSWAQAIAVRAGRILAVGSDDALADLRGEDTEIVDLAGRMVLPGFQDAHAHPVSGGLDRLQCDMHDLDTRASYLEAVATYAGAYPDEPWITGGGWSQDVFPRGCPSKEELDAIVADRPIVLPNRDGHSAWVNSRALELAGIDASTPDPDDGRIERNADGSPQGTLHEGAMYPVTDLLPAPSPAMLDEGLGQGQAYMHSLGITAWQDAGVERGAIDTYAAYRRAAGSGELTARVVGALLWERTEGLDQIDRLLEMRAGASGRFRASSVKIHQDGVCENFTGAVLDPYLDEHGNPTDNRGISFVDPAVLDQAVTRLDELGFQVHFHALADRAVREALNAIQAARAANGWSDGRHHLAHLQLVHPDDISRFRELGAVANLQPLWAAHEAQMDELTIPFLGEPRWRWQYPFASLQRSGAQIAMGSDWPVSTADPLAEMHVAVNRQMPPNYTYRVDDHEVFLPEERLDLPSAIHGFTMGSAYANHLDRETGSIEAGKYADLAVIDRDLFARPVDEISSARCVMTYVEGVQVYAADDA